MSLRNLLVAVSISTSFFATSHTFADVDPADKQAQQVDPKTDKAAENPDPILPITEETPVIVDDASVYEGPITNPIRDILADTAGSYGTFQADVSNYNRIFKSQDDILKASTELGTHNAEELASGWLAYSALLASQSSQFADEVRKADAYFGRDEFIQIMNRDVTYTMRLDGSDDALNKALNVSKADSKRLTRIGKSLAIQSGNTLQAFGWAKARLRGNRTTYVRDLEKAAIDGRPVFEDIQTLFDIGSVNGAIQKADTLGSDTSLWDNLLSTDGTTTTDTEFKLPTFDGSGFTTFSPFARRKKKYDFLNGRITTLAAMRILNETDEVSPELTRALTDKDVPGGLSMTSCLKMSQLQYFACVEGNQFVYERAFCIGEHAVTDVGRCIDKFSN